MLPAVFNPADYVLRGGMLQQKNNPTMPLHRVAALYAVRAALFWPGSTAGGAGLYGALRLGGTMVGTHRIAALYQVLHNAGDA